MYDISIYFYSHIPLVTIDIADKKPLLEFDIGAANVGIALTKDLIIEEHGIYSDRMEYSYDALGVQQNFKEDVIPTLKIDGLTLSNVRGTEYHPWGNLLGDYQYVLKGAIGISFLKSHLDYLVIDYKKGLMTLIKGYVPQYDLNSFVRMKYVYDRGLIKTELLINGILTSVLFDSGFAESMISDKHPLAKQSQDCLKNNSDEPTCQVVSTILSLPNGQQIGQCLFYLNNIPERFLDRIQAVLGYNYFMKNIVIIDFKHQYIYAKENNA